MNRNSRFMRPAILTLSITAPVVMLCAAALTHVRAQPPERSDGELAGKKFKNIKVLKNLPADKLIPTMHAWNTSLGVQCEFCHVVGPNHSGFERDDKPAKNMARAMVTMTMDLNKHQKALDNKATCYLCHHGHANPENRPGSEGGERPGPGGGR